MTCSVSHYKFNLEKSDTFCYPNIDLNKEDKILKSLVQTNGKRGNECK